MHELSITRSVVAIVAERAAGQRVTRVRLQIGCLSAVMPDAIRFCFDLCAVNTAAARDSSFHPMFLVRIPTMVSRPSQQFLNPHPAAV